MKDLTVLEQRASRIVQSNNSETKKTGRMSAAIIFEIADQLSQILPEKDQERLVQYVASNSDTLNSSDGYEAIQIIWGPSAQIITHMLLTKEARDEHKSGRFLNTFTKRSLSKRDVIKAEMLGVLEMREEQRGKQHKLPLAMKATA